MSQELLEVLKNATCDVPTAGRLAFGLSRNASYDAANRGDLVTIRVGRLRRVPCAWLRKILMLEAA